MSRQPTTAESSSGQGCALTLAGGLLSGLLLLSGHAAAIDGVSPPAPDPHRRLSEYALDHWTIDDGLPQNTVLAMASGPHGYLWIATFEGLVRFDGLEFHRFRPEEAPGLWRGTTELLVDDDGALWVGTQANGLFRIRSDGAIHHFDHEHGLTEIIWSLHQDAAGRLWVGTARGLCRLDGDIFTCLDDSDGLPRVPITAVRSLPDGALWVGTRDTGLYHLKDGEARHYTSVDGVSIAHVHDLAMDSGGRLWVATFGAGLVSVEDGRFRIIGVDQGLVSDLIRSVTVDSAGGVWIGTYGSGLQRLIDDRMELLDSGAGLPNGHVQSLHIDREGSLWFGTSGGLNRLYGATFVTISQREGLSHPFVRVVAQSAGGDMWVGTDSDGLNRIRDGRIIAVMQTPQLLSNSVRALWPAADGGMWVGAYEGGVTRLDANGDPVAQYREGLGDLQIRALLEDRGGALWIGTERGGITRLKGDRMARFSTAEGLRTADVRAIAEAPDGSIWFGTYGEGLARYRSDKLEHVDVIPDGIVFAIRFNADGAAWIGTETGLFHYSTDGQVRPVAAQQGLDRAVFQVLDDGLGRLWLCTNTGIVALDAAAARAGSPEIPMDRYGTDQGMLSRQCNGASQPAGWRDDEGRLWFPTAAGVSWVDPGNLTRSRVPPPVVIQGVRIDGRQVASGAAPLEVKPGARRVEIDYAGLTFISPHRVSYRYRLHEYDDAWIDAGNRRSAFYNDLPPGRYDFQVTAANAAGVWNPTGATLGVIQQPFVHQTAWFRSLLVAAVLLLIAAIYRWRMADLRRHNEALEATVAERTRRLSDANANLERTLEVLRRTQDDLVQSEKMAALGGLVAGVAHEINTPVGNSITVASHLRRRCDVLEAATDPEAGGREVDRIRRGIDLMQADLERTRTVISSFKRVAVSKERIRRRTFRLREVFLNTRLNFAQELQVRGHELSAECPQDLELDSYPDALEEVLAHLIGNSIAHGFSGPGGTITVAAHREGSQVSIDYRDDGLGIDPKVRHQVFDPFFTNRRGNHAGLGLHIVYNIVSWVLNGEVVCLEGPGAHFRLIVPEVAPE